MVGWGGGGVEGLQGFLGRRNPQTQLSVPVHAECELCEAGSQRTRSRLPSLIRERIGRTESSEFVLSTPSVMLHLGHDMLQALPQALGIEARDREAAKPQTGPQPRPT